MAIEEEGFQVVAEADDVPSLLTGCRRHRPDIILLDLDIDSPRSIRLIEDLLDIDMTMTVIAISEPIDVPSELLLMAGARAYIQKPFTIYDLIDTMRKVIPTLRRG